MPAYYVNRNTQPTGEHEVHKEGWYRMPELQNRLYLGYFSNANDAVIEARKYFREVDGCYYCSNEAHKR